MKTLYRLFNLFVAGCLVVIMIGSVRSARAATTIIVNDTSDTVSNDGKCTLREAIVSANTETVSGGSAGECAAGSGADTITFDSGLSGATITLGSDLVAITTDMTIDGSALASQITIHGSDLHSIFYISNSNAIVLLKSVTIAHGRNETTGSGGGIHNKGTLTVTDSTLQNNFAYLGGGIANGGSLTVSYSSINGNVASVVGGGLINFSYGSLTVNNSTINNNFAVEGGGAAYLQGVSTITNSTFNSNSADLGGGGIHILGISTVKNSTFSGNSAAYTGGNIYIFGQLLMTNSIVANSPSGGDCVNDGGTITLNLNNLIEDGSCSPALSGDPKLNPLANNGGPTQTMLPQIDSPAINAGDGSECPTDDQRGVTRPQGGQCDIGAVESEDYPVTATFTSVGVNDGYLSESGENSNKGGSGNSTGGAIFVGDGLGDRQYRGLLHFDTSSLPDTAVITGLTLQIKRQGITGSDPFTILGDLTVSIRMPFFGSTSGLAVSDFQAVADASAGTFDPTLLPDNWYSATLDSAAFPFVNLSGPTQFRLAFSLDDNDDGGADYLKFYSGNNATVSYRPVLIVEYYVP